MALETTAAPAPAATGQSYCSGTDILLNPDGSTYHVGAKAGDVYPRIITVGCHTRAKQISLLLDNVEKELKSSRMFHVYSGKYKGVGVTIVAIGMGAPMMDFFVRECSFICPEPMAVIRIGTCGLFNPSLQPGTVVCAGKGSCYSYINHSAFTGGTLDGKPPATQSKYLVTAPVLGDSELNSMLFEELIKNGVPSHNGLNCAGETFFAAQGRQDSHFANYDNTSIMQSFSRYNVDSCEMEAFTLFQLARQRTIAPLKVAACHIGILNRVNPAMTENIGTQQLKETVDLCSKSALEALVRMKL